MMDMHCHILPGVDDGARDLQEALEMARIAVADGIRTIVATPHVFDHELAGAGQRIRQWTEAFQGALEEAGIALRVIPGAEIRISPSLPQWAAKGELPLIGDSQYALVELAFNDFPSYLGKVFFELKLAGITPIIAHPERNRGFAEDPNRLLPYLRQGALTQINGGSLRGHFGETAQETALIMIQNHMAHMVGSDAHRSKRPRRPTLSRCRQQLEELIGGEQALEILETFPKRVIANQSFQRREAMEYRPPRKFWGFALGLVRR